MTVDYLRPLDALIARWCEKNHDKLRAFDTIICVRYNDDVAGLETLQFQVQEMIAGNPVLYSQTVDMEVLRSNPMQYLDELLGRAVKAMDAVRPKP